MQLEKVWKGDLPGTRRRGPRRRPGLGSGRNVGSRGFPRHPPSPPPTAPAADQCEDTYRRECWCGGELKCQPQRPLQSPFLPSPLSPPDSSS
ncbi:Glycine N-Acyltransferase-Like Protein 3 [Manis pentadactyla]|nr:Glycine N-Acyltransferase-Like Protein 3 [Manis pentadactyla]